MNPRVTHVAVQTMESQRTQQETSIMQDNQETIVLQQQVIVRIPINLNEETGGVVRRRFYDYDGKRIGSGKKPLPLKFLKPAFHLLYQEGKFLPDYLKDEYSLVPVTVVRGGKKVTVMRLVQGDKPVLANPKKAGTPVTSRISGQDVWQQQHPAVRQKMAAILHAVFERHIPTNMELPPPPIRIQGELHTQPRLWNWDIGNMFPIGKTFTDHLKKRGLIPDDNISIVTQEPTGLLFRPIGEDEQAYLIFSITHDGEAAANPHFLKPQTAMVNTTFPFKQAFPDMYVKDSKGQIRVFSIRVTAEDYRAARIVSNTGQLNGKMVAQTKIVTKGKNLGKINATIPLEQALSDVQSSILKKEREGYKTLEQLNIVRTHDDEMVQTEFTPGKMLTISEEFIFEYAMFNSLYAVLKKALPIAKVSKEGEVLPMKAQSYWKDPKTRKKIRPSFPCFAQPKINGVRTLVSWENGRPAFRSKKGLDYTLPHIQIPESVFRKVAEVLEIPIENVLLDGELYIPGYKLQDITSAVRVHQLATPLVELHVFDLAVPKMEQQDRTALLKDVTFHAKMESVVVVKTYKIANHSQAVTLFKQFIAEGYEGLITRSIDGVYAFGHRVPYMTKLKQKESKEFRIIDIVDTDKNPGVAIFVCRNDVNDETFKVNPQGTLSQKMYWYDNKHMLIGKQATVEFYERTEDEIPLHATLVAIRDYE